MPNQYTKEQLWKLYEKLPKELQEAVFSVETADNIWSVCENNGIDAVSEVAKIVGQVLVGVLPPEDFQDVLEKELKLKKDAAKKTAQEINRFIFYPVRTELENLYNAEVAVSAKSTEVTAPAIEKIAERQEKQPSAPKMSAKGDTYREPIE